MPSISAVRKANELFKPSYLPVAIFVGGTSGIGQGLVEAFARHTNGNAHIMYVPGASAFFSHVLTAMQNHWA